MIKEIIDLLNSDDFYNVSDTVEIAKGKNQLVTTWKGFKRKIKRKWQLKK